MCFFFSLMPATICVTVGYFVLFAASKADDRIKIFGWVLAIWLAKRPSDAIPSTPLRTVYVAAGIAS